MAFTLQKSTDSRGNKQPWNYEMDEFERTHNMTFRDWEVSMISNGANIMKTFYDFKDADYYPQSNEIVMNGAIPNFWAEYLHTARKRLFITTFGTDFKISGGKFRGDYVS